MVGSSPVQLAGALESFSCPLLIQKPLHFQRCKAATCRCYAFPVAALEPCGCTPIFLPIGHSLSNDFLFTERCSDISLAWSSVAAAMHVTTRLFISDAHYQIAAVSDPSISFSSPTLLFRIFRTSNQFI